MTGNSIEIEFDGEDFCINDANSPEAWMAAFADFIEDQASQNYQLVHEHESEKHDLSIEMQRKIAEGISDALVRFRSDAVKPQIDGESKDSWETLVRRAVRNAAGFGDMMYEDPQQEALDRTNFQELKDAIEEAIENHGGITLDAETIYDEIYWATINRMHELDTTDELDTYGKPGIKFIFVPSSMSNHSVDDITLYLDDFQKIDAQSWGFDALMKLTKVDALDLMESLNIDSGDSKTIDKFLEYSSKQVPEEPLIPVSSEDDYNLIYLLENSGVTYGTPMWIGELSVNEIIKINPLEDIYLSGGSFGINDFDNGCGFMMDLPEGKSIKLGQDDWIKREYGYSMECEKGSISSSAPQLKKKPRLSFDDTPSLR